MKINTFEDLINIAERIGDIIGNNKTEVNIILPKKEYEEYCNNPANSLQAYMDKNNTLPVLVYPASESHKDQPLISFMHRTGIKVTLNTTKEDIYR